MLEYRFLWSDCGPCREAASSRFLLEGTFFILSMNSWFGVLEIWIFQEVHCFPEYLPLFIYSSFFGVGFGNDYWKRDLFLTGFIPASTDPAFTLFVILEPSRRGNLINSFTIGSSIGQLLISIKLVAKYITWQTRTRHFSLFAFGVLLGLSCLLIVASKQRIRTWISSSEIPHLKDRAPRPLAPQGIHLDHWIDTTPTEFRNVPLNMISDTLL